MCERHHDPVITEVQRVRRALSRVLQARVALQALGAALASWLMMSFLLDAVGVDDAMGVVVQVLPIAIATIVAAVCALMLWRDHGPVSPVRAALWIEEHGDTGFALVTGSSRPSGATHRLCWGCVARASQDARARARSALAPGASATVGRSRSSSAPSRHPGAPDGSAGQRHRPVDRSPAHR
jgi:hypothetical protein